MSSAPHVVTPRLPGQAAQQQVELKIGGMTCVSCAARIEKKLNKLDGVTATVNYSTEVAQVSFPVTLLPADLAAEVVKIGYTATLPPPREAAEDPQESRPTTDPAQALRQRLLISLVLSVPVIVLAMVPAWQFDNWQWASLALAGPVVVYGGLPFHRAAWTNLRYGAASLGLSLRRLQRSLPTQARILEPALDQAVDEIGHAITDLRRIASGVRPARLDDGLAAALEDLARHTPIPVTVNVPTQRVPPTVEAPAYYVACEAVTNAVKHADATRIIVQAERRNGSLHLLVADDGIGGARIRPGTGLAGLVDRVSAHGGTLAVDSHPGAGTRMEAMLPCEL